MIDRLVRTFLSTPILAILLCAVLAGWGWQSFKQNPKDAIPDIAENQAIVFTEWMGRSPKDVDEQVTYPLGECVMCCVVTPSEPGRWRHHDKTRRALSTKS